MSGGGRVDVLLQRIDPDLPLPTYARPGDAGMDLYARENLVLGPGERALMPTGIAIALPPGYVAFVHPRSGLAARHGLTIVNAPGTIDAAYRGEIVICLLNTDVSTAVEIHRGDRVAQLIIQAVCVAVCHEVDVLPGTHRGADGYGSTGTVGGPHRPEGP